MQFELLARLWHDASVSQRQRVESSEATRQHSVSGTVAAAAATGPRWQLPLALDCWDADLLQSATAVLDALDGQGSDLVRGHCVLAAALCSTSHTSSTPLATL